MNTISGRRIFKSKDRSQYIDNSCIELLADFFPQVSTTTYHMAKPIYGFRWSKENVNSRQLQKKKENVNSQ